MSFKSVMLLLEIINIIAIAILTALLIYYVFVKKTFREMSSGKWLMLIGIVCTASITLSLGWLSFTYSAQKGYIGDWNYISEGRYYALVIIFLQLSFLAWVFHDNNWKKSFWQKTIISICTIVLFVEVSHSIYFQTKVTFNFKEYKSSIYREQDYNYFNELLPKLEKENPAHEILVAAPGDNFYTYTAAYFGMKGIFDAPKLKQGPPKVKTATFLIVMLYNDQPHGYNSFITIPGVELIKQIDYSNFYLIELTPQ